MVGKMTEKEQITVTSAENGIRIDRLLADRFPELTRSYIQKMIRDGDVLANEKLIRASYKAAEGDVIHLELPEPEPLAIEPENIPLDILYEDADLLVVNKPKGMVVHPAAGHYSGTLVNAVLYHCGDSLSGNRPSSTASAASTSSGTSIPTGSFSGAVCARCTACQSLPGRNP